MWKVGTSRLNIHVEYVIKIYGAVTQWLASVNIEANIEAVKIIFRQKGVEAVDAWSFKPYDNLSIVTHTV